MTSIEIAFESQMYTVEYEIIETRGVCEFCKQEKPNVEKLNISYIVRQQSLADGKNIDINSDFGKEIIERVNQEIIDGAACLDCLTEINS